MIRVLLVSAALAMVSLSTFAEQVPGADPEFIGGLAKEIGGTTAQAEGAAGSIFGLAKSRMSPGDFTKLSSAVPGMDGLLKAAPAAAGATGIAGAAGAASMAGGMSGLSSLAGSFTKLGLKPDMVAKAVPVVSNYVTKSGGAELGKLFAGVMK